MVLKFDFEISDALLGMSPREMPVYTMNDAVNYLAIPRSTLRDWFLGQNNSKNTFAPIFDLADKKAQLLSFENLAEAYVYRVLRGEYTMNANKIRKALTLLGSKYGTQHPLARHDFLTDGWNLFVEIAGERECLTEQHQLFFPWHADYLKRIVWKEGIAARMFPATRFHQHAKAESPVAGPHSIMVDPDFAFGAAAIASNGVATKLVAQRYIAGESVEVLAQDYRCHSFEIEDAIRAEWKWQNAA